MAWAVFHRVYNHDLRPARAACLTFQPSARPQQARRIVVDAAVKRGAATEVPAPPRAERLALRP